MKVLTRVLPIRDGQIQIDHRDISTMPESKLRETFTVIGADHAIFEGSLRFNVDPTGLHDDDKVEKKLRSIGAEVGHDGCLNRLLKSSNPKPGPHDYRERSVEGNGTGIYFNIGKGVYVSDYERQLIAICRAALHKKQFILIDDLTNCNDYTEEAAIMKIMEKNFKDSIIINFTDRFHTVLKYDKIVYIGSGGGVKEQGDPQELLQRYDSEFY